MRKIAIRLAPPAWFAVALATLATLAGCISPRVAVEASDAAPIAIAETIHVAFASEQTAAAEAGAEPVVPAIAEALRADAERLLEQRGYAMGTAASSDLVLEIAARSERTALRTWSSDPDASASRVVRRPEAVIVLRARDRDTGREVWACDARARLSESSPVFGTSEEAVWRRVLAAALEDVPPRE